MKLTTKKHKISPFVAGLECEILSRGHYEEEHNDFCGNVTILKYDLRIKMPSGMITFANSEWFEKQLESQGKSND